MTAQARRALIQVNRTEIVAGSREQSAFWTPNRAESGLFANGPRRKAGEMGPSGTPERAVTVQHCPDLFVLFARCGPSAAAFFRHHMSRFCLSRNSQSVGPLEQKDSFQRRPESRACPTIRLRRAADDRGHEGETWATPGHEKSRQSAWEQDAAGRMGFISVFYGGGNAPPPQ